MIPVRRKLLLIIFFASTFINGSVETNATNLTTNDVENSTTTLTNVNTICGYKTCLPLCCSIGEALVYGSCVKDNYTTGILPENVSENDFQLLKKDPCAFGWMASSYLIDFNVWPDGTIFAEGSVYHSEHYCLFREPKSPVYLARVCQPWIVTVYWQIALLVFSAVILLLIVICYSVVPELKNLHGLMFRAYLVSYILSHACLIGQQCFNKSETYSYLFTLCVFGLHYCAACCALWLNAMSFNIWRTFRGLGPINSNVRNHERKKFLRYAIYAWVTPAVAYLTIIGVMIFVPYFRKFSLNKNLILWCCATTLTSVVIVNTFFYAATAIKIRQHKKDTANITNGVNKHNGEHRDLDKQWFNLHVKLFFITGVHTIMWVIWELWPITVNTYIMMMIEVLQSILLFFIFVWKDNVRESIQKKFDDTLSRFNNTFSAGSSNFTFAAATTKV